MEGRFPDPPVFPLLTSSVEWWRRCCSRVVANSSSSGTASSSSSLGKRSPRERNESVVEPELEVLLRLRFGFFRLPVHSSSSPSSTNGSVSSMVLYAPGCSCRSAAEGLYLKPLPPIFQGNRPRKPNADVFGMIVGSGPPS